MIRQEAHEYNGPGVGGQTGDFTHLTYSPKRVGLRGGRASPLLESGKRWLHQEVGAERLTPARQTMWHLLSGIGTADLVCKRIHWVPPLRLKIICQCTRPGTER